MAQVIQVKREGVAIMADEAIRLPAGVWLDSMRIDCTNDDGPEPELLAEWSCVDGWVEISVPVDLGALGETVTVRFPGWLIPGITNHVPLWMWDTNSSHGKPSVRDRMLPRRRPRRGYMRGIG